MISTTYQRIPEERLCELLGLQDEDMMNQWIGNFESKPHIYVKVSLLGVDTLLGDCTFIQADWGS